MSKIQSMSDQITILCKRTVVSTKPVQPEKFYHLSALDQVMEPNRPIQMVSYYRTPPGRAVEAVTKKLRESISELLNSFPMVAGRLLKNDEGQWMIKCNDARVRLVEAPAKGSVEGWLRRADREKELELVHWEDMYYKPYFWSTFFVQLTEFEEGCLPIGLSCTHLLVDPPSAAMFVKAWADITLGGKMLTLPLFQPLPLPKPGNKNTNHLTYTALIDRYKTSIQYPTLDMANQHATVTFGFTDEIVQSCIAIPKTIGAPDDSSLMPFEALAGLFWVCVSKIKGEGHGTLTNMSISLDMRETLGLDRLVFGNCMVCHKVPALECLEDQNGLSEATFVIGEAVKKMENQSILDLIEQLEGDNFESYSISTICS